MNKPSISGVYIGSDEVLKGDTFGGIVVCAFKGNEEIRPILKAMNVRDSKKMLKQDITKTAQELMAQFPRNFHVENIFPDEYNKICKKCNMTHILDLLHEKCHKKLTSEKEKPKHVIDEYPGCKLKGIVETRAESKYLEVAAASIIARYEGLKQIRQLEQMAGFFIPMGSTHVVDALMELKRKELDPTNFIKMNFKNVQKMFG